jgi:hypothetical protein
MKKGQISTLRDLKRVHSELFDTMKETLEEEGGKLVNFELDYFVYDKRTHTYFITLSCGIGDELQLFDMTGEMIDDEVSVNSASFDRSMSKDDFFDPDSAFMREMLPEDDSEHDNDY